MTTIRAGLPVLTYHAIGPERSVTATDPARFADTISALLDTGHHGVDLADWVARGRPDEPRGFALAFDDGLRSILGVIDVLTRFRVPATVFLVAGRVGSDNAWPGQLAGVAIEPLLSWREIKNLATEGVRFGAHGVSHHPLDRLDAGRLTGELTGSRATIEDRLGLPCPLLAYPDGSTSRAVLRASAGVFEASFGTRLDYADNVQDAFALSRIDAFYLRSRRVLDALIHGRASGWLRRRRALRAVRRVSHRFSHGWRPVGSAVRTVPRPESVRTAGPTGSPSKLVCPRCHGPIERTASRDFECRPCGLGLPSVAGIPDFRLQSDRYLDLCAERAKAERLAGIEALPGPDVMNLARAYYDMTGDVVDHRRDRFLRHIAGAEGRGEALAAQLPGLGTTLEIGCGTGGLLASAAKGGKTIVGVDIASRWLVVARRRLADHGLDVPLVAAEAEQLPWPDGTFDAVVADSVLEHLDDPPRALREWRRVLKPGGTLVLWSPNRFTLTTDPHLGLWGLGWLPRRWTSAYLRFRGRHDWTPKTLSASEARRLAQKCGWAHVSVGVPDIPEGWARTRPRHERLMIRAYRAARVLFGVRQALRAFGPLWELRAEKHAEGGQGKSGIQNV